MIGVFDSGVGGLSVLAEIRSLMPEADLLYVADRERAPYGTRSLDEVRAISHEVAHWLLDQGASCLVIACNTASAAALESIRAEHPGLEVVGMEPAVKPAAAMSQANTVGVFATAATFQGRLFDSVVDRHAKGTRILTMACPEWVDLVEDGVVDGRKARKLVTDAVQPMVDKGADVLVLGCTHFAFLEPIISDVARVPVIDPSNAVARRVASVAGSATGSATTKLLSSGNVHDFRRLVEALTNLEGDFGAYPS